MDLCKPFPALSRKGVASCRPEVARNWSSSRAFGEKWAILGRELGKKTRDAAKSSEPSSRGTSPERVSLLG